MKLCKFSLLCVSVNQTQAIFIGQVKYVIKCVSWATDGSIHITLMNLDYYYYYYYYYCYYHLSITWPYLLEGLMED